MRYTEDMIPEGFRLQVQHFHEGNSTTDQRAQMIIRESDTLSPKYVTVARIFRKCATSNKREDDRYICAGFAFCSPKDTPRRQVGRQIAIARAVKELLEYIDVGFV